MKKGHNRFVNLKYVKSTKFLEVGVGGHEMFRAATVKGRDLVTGLFLQGGHT